MNKKLLTGILASSFLLSTTNVFATDKTLNGTTTTDTTELTYTVSQSYSVTIPATVTIGSGKTGTASVVLAAHPILSYDKRYLHIRLASTNGWKLTTTEDTTGLAYKAGTISGGTEISTSSKQVEFEAVGTASETSKTVYFEITGDVTSAKFAGDYKDTVTFTLTTDDNAPA
ncbi:MAG: hypothetical protein LBR30_05700 [Clostridioides sp.]|jgi:hypothetical protein|nr:hypothetical protein [Clostridioides sp.]